MVAPQKPAELSPSCGQDCAATGVLAAPPAAEASAIAAIAALSRRFMDPPPCLLPHRR